MQNAWYCIPTFYSILIRVGHPFFSKERFVLAFISVQYKRTFRSLRSFPFSAKERFVFYVHFRSVLKNVSFSTFISVQCKRTFRSLRSFLFCRKNVQFILVRLGPKNDQNKAFLGVKSGSKRAKKIENQTKRSKNERNVHFRSLQMNVAFSTFIPVH